MATIVEAEKSTLKSISMSLNSQGELAITAVDGNNEDASNPGLVYPQRGAFLLLWNPLDRNWIVSQDLLSGIEPGYQIIRIIKEVVE